MGPIAPEPNEPFLHHAWEGHVLSNRNGNRGVWPGPGALVSQPVRDI